MRVFAVACALTLFAAAGCTHNESGAATASAPYATPNQTAIDNITSARCNREMSCDGIGTGKPYDSFEMCQRELSRNTGTSLRPTECPNGVRETGLSACMSDLENERCNMRIDTIERVSTCSREKLCI